MPRREQAVRAALFAAAVLCCCGVAAGATTSSTPAKDTFRGHITKATGRLAGDTGRITVLLHVAQSTEAVRKLELTLSGAPCAGAEHCLRLSGLLSGTLSARPAMIPDVGKRYDVSVSGSLSTFSHVSATGNVTGVGFVRVGRETLTLTLETPQGKVMIVTLSPRVPGFTSP